MAIRDRSPILFSQGLDTETYRCGACGVEATLTSRPEEMRFPDVGRLDEIHAQAGRSDYGNRVDPRPPLTITIAPPDVSPSPGCPGS
jgi:hypothetical protein